MVAPFLSVLFGNGEVITEKPELTLSSQSLIDTFYYYVGMVIRTHGAFSALLFIAITMIVLTFFSNLFRYLGLYSNATIRAGIVKNMRTEIYGRLLVLPLSFYGKNKKGDILNRISADVQEVEWSVVCGLQMLFRDPLLVVVFLITLFTISVKLTLLALLILPLTGLLIAWIGKSIKKNAVESKKILGTMSAAFDEAITGLRIIKGYNAIDNVNQRFQKLNDRFFILNRRIFRKTELGAPLVEFLCILALMMVLLLGAGFVLSGNELHAEMFIMFIVIFARVIPPAQNIVATYYTLQKGMASADRIFQILDADEVIEEVRTPIEKRQLEREIAYRHVFFSYENNEVLSDINFSLKKGQSIALVGPSGSGKSTIVDLLPRFYDVCKGEILIDGIDIKSMKISDLRHIFGIVNQDVILFNDTVFNNIAFGKKGVTKEMVEKAAKAALAHDFIMEMDNGYDTIIGDRGMKLSGGQRQRLSIARAILQDPQVLILDEATSALDNASEFIVQESLQQLMKGRTTIVIAHRLSTIRHVDHILFVEGGRIVERGSHEDLLNQGGAYAKFCALQNLQ